MQLCKKMPFLTFSNTFGKLQFFTNIRELYKYYSETVGINNLVYKIYYNE